MSNLRFLNTLTHNLLKGITKTTYLLNRTPRRCYSWFFTYTDVVLSVRSLMVKGRHDLLIESKREIGPKKYYSKYESRIVFNYLDKNNEWTNYIPNSTIQYRRLYWIVSHEIFVPYYNMGKAKFNYWCIYISFLRQHTDALSKQ